MEIIVSELRLATLIISSCLGGFLFTECICRQDMNIPRSLFFGDSGIFMPTTTVYAWPDINIGAFECDIAPFIFWKYIIISFVIKSSTTVSYISNLKRTIWWWCFLLWSFERCRLFCYCYSSSLRRRTWCNLQSYWHHLESLTQCCDANLDFFFSLQSFQTLKKKS